jgi:hypothetical protein
VEVNRLLVELFVEREALASVGTLVLGLGCSWCLGSVPMPKLIGLSAQPPARRQQTM